MRKTRASLILLALAFTAQTSFAQMDEGCSEEYINSLNSAVGTGSIAVGGFLGATTGGFASFAAGAPLMIGAATTGFGVAGTLGAIEGVVALTNIKEKKMLRLIKESKAYHLNKAAPGRVLRRLHRKVSRKLDNVSLEEVAKFVVDADNQKAFCSGYNLVSFNRLKKDLKSGVLQIDMYDEDSAYNAGYADGYEAGIASPQINESDRGAVKERATASETGSQGHTVGSN